MKNNLNKKKVVVTIIIILILTSIIITFIIVKKSRNGTIGVVPRIEEERDDGMVKYENLVNGIEIADRKVEKIDGKQYIVIQIKNTSDQDKFDLPIGVEFVNKDGEVIYNTGYVVDVLLKGMKEEIYALVTPQIAEMVEKDKIDHIVIKELQ